MVTSTSAGTRRGRCRRRRCRTARQTSRLAPHRSRHVATHQSNRTGVTHSNRSRRARASPSPRLRTQRLTFTPRSKIGTSIFKNVRHNLFDDIYQHFCSKTASNWMNWLIAILTNVRETKVFFENYVQICPKMSTSWNPVSFYLTNFFIYKTTEYFVYAFQHPQLIGGKLWTAFKLYKWWL